MSSFVQNIANKRHLKHQLERIFSRHPGAQGFPKKQPSNFLPTFGSAMLRWTFLLILLFQLQVLSRRYQYQSAKAMLKKWVKHGRAEEKQDKSQSAEAEKNSLEHMSTDKKIVFGELKRQRADLKKILQRQSAKQENC